MKEDKSITTTYTTHTTTQNYSTIWGDIIERQRLDALMKKREENIDTILELSDKDQQ
jgi:hypothetical protein